jgi:hypothetical protein
MKYVERVLQPGETVQYWSTVHWIVYAPSILLLIVGVIGLAVLVEGGASPRAFVATSAPAHWCWLHLWPTQLLPRLVQTLDNRTRCDQPPDHIQTWFRTPAYDRDEHGQSRACRRRPVFLGSHLELWNYCRARNGRWPRTTTENRLPDRVSQRCNGTLTVLSVGALTARPERKSRAEARQEIYSSLIARFMAVAEILRTTGCPHVVTELRSMRFAVKGAEPATQPGLRRPDRAAQPRSGSGRLPCPLSR